MSGAAGPVMGIISAWTIILAHLPRKGHAEVVRRVLLLLDPVVRSDPDRVCEFLHPDYLDFGHRAADGTWSPSSRHRQSTPASPSQEEPLELAAVHVADDVGRASTARVAISFAEAQAGPAGRRGRLPTLWRRPMTSPSRRKTVRAGFGSSAART